MHDIWPYLNDMAQSRIEAIYTLNNLIEICYTKENRTRSVTIGFDYHRDALGYMEHFCCDSIPLPPTKSKHPFSACLHTLSHCNLYVSDDGWEHYEEMELISEEGRFLLCFDADTTTPVYAKIVKDKAPTFAKMPHVVAVLPQELFSVEAFKEHLAFALNAHGEQKTPHGLPYSMHLLSVVSEVINALYMEPLSYDEHNVAIACALLHDVNEDTQTKITPKTPLSGHQEVIVKGVAALTKDKTLPTKEAQMNDSIERLKKRQRCVVLVKLADRITNLGTPPSHWDRTKKSAYLEEARLILEHLGYAHHYLADKLFQKIKAYESYM